jgi:UDP-N-acetylenolpyruvoylglucosamine reductase
MKTTDGSISRPGSPAALRSLLSAASVVLENESMARRTTLRVGGCADLWVEPASERDLAATLVFAREAALPVLVVGRGSNLLVRDGGLRGLVVSLSQSPFSSVEGEGDQLRCGAGARLKAVALEARKHALSGLEFLEGIPGSVGGALRMNAGAHGGCVFDRVVEVRLLDFEGKIHVLARDEIEAGYRSCPTLRSHVAVEALLRGIPSDEEAIGRRMKEFNQLRWASQPAAPSAGCMFKNPASVPAGKLVDELGLKGTRVGGAVVSQEHGNFIVTEGHTSSTDVLELIDRIKAEVRRQTGIELETEVQVVGEEGGVGE